MTSEIETVNDIIEQEIREASEAAATSSKPRPDFEILLDAYNALEKDRTLDHWRVLFFNEQQNRCELEQELSQVRRKHHLCSVALRRTWVNMSGIRNFSEALDEFLSKWGLHEPDSHVGVMVNIARSFLRDVTLRIEVPPLSDTDIADIPY